MTETDLEHRVSASPAALMASCEITTFVASILDPELDQLTVITTHTPESASRSFTTVWPLQKSNARQIRKAVDRIVGDNDEPEALRYKEALEHARDVLLQSSREEIYENGVPKVYGHILVISPRLRLTTKELDIGENVQAHFICPAVLPWKGQYCDQIAGWYLSSSYSRINTPITATGSDGSLLQEQLRKLIIQARKGINCGKLTDLYLELQAGPHCFIDGIMGDTEISALRMGELRTVLVKVRTDSLPSTKPTLSTFPHGFSSSTESIDLVRELNAMIGNASACILKAELSYNHSLLPGSTRCSIEAEAHVRWAAPALNPLPPSGDLNPANKENCRSIQRRLVYYLATHQLPRDAEATINKEFGKNGSRPLCLDYIKDISEELKYQARLMERFDLNYTEASQYVSDHFRDVYDLISEAGPARFRSNTAKSEDTFDLTKNTARGRSNTTGSADTFTLSEESSNSQLTLNAEEEDLYDLTSDTLATPKPNKPKLHTSNPPTPGTVIHRRRPRATLIGTDDTYQGSNPPPQEPLVQDKARKIWSELRRESRSQKRLFIDGTSNANNGTATADFGTGVGVDAISGLSESGRLRMRELRDMAIRNRRSIGADTLRSFSLDVAEPLGSGDGGVDGRVGMRGASAPWL